MHVVFHFYFLLGSISLMDAFLNCCKLNFSEKIYLIIQA